VSGVGLSIAALLVFLVAVIGPLWLGVMAGRHFGKQWTGWLVFVLCLGLSMAVFHEPLTRLGFFAEDSE
jgi:hypothetical protein